MKIRHPVLRAIPAALALLCMQPAPGGAVVHVWTGSGASPNWSDGANWSGGLPPSGAGLELLLDSAARPSTFNDISGVTLLGLTLGSQAAQPTLTGQPVHFEGAGAYLRMLSNGGPGRVQTALVLGSTLRLDGGPTLESQLFLQGAISGSGGLAVLSGHSVLSGANSYTGATTVAAGAALGVFGNSLGAHTAVQVAAGGELQLVGPGGSIAASRVGAPVQLAGLLSSSARKIDGGFGPVAGARVDGNITLTGDARVLAFGAAGGGLAATELVVAGTVDRAGRVLTLETGGANNTLSINGAITGNGDMVLRPNGGRIGAGSISGNGAVRVVGAGGVVTLGAVSGSGVLDVAFSDNSFGDVVAGGAISGARPIHVSSGTLNLGSQAHSFVGTVQMAGLGRVSATTHASLGAASNALHFDQGGALTLTGSATLSRAILTTGGTGFVEVQGNNTGNVSSVITGDGGIGFGTSGLRSQLTLSGANSFAGGLSIGSTVLMLFNTDANLGAAGGRISLAGILAMPGGFTLDRPLEVAGSAAALNGTTGQHRLTGPITGSGALNLGGSGADTVFSLQGSATHTGGVKLALATLELDSDSRLGPATGVLDIGRANGLSNLPATLRATANLAIAATRSTSFRDMTVDTNGFAVEFNQPIDGLGMTKVGAGTWTLNTANSNSSNTHLVNVLQGTLALGVNEALGGRSRVSVADAAVLALQGRTLTLSDIGSNANGVVDLGSGGRLTTMSGVLNGSLIGQGALVVGRAGLSGGELTLNTANTFTGTVEVTQGSRLTLGHAQALGAPGNMVRLDNGTLMTSAALATPLVISEITHLQIDTGGAGFVAQGQSLVIERALTGSAPLKIEGGSLPGSGGEKFDVRLAHRENSFVGNLVIGDPERFGSAVVGITADGSLGASSNRIILGRSVFDGETTRVAQGGLRAWDTLTLAASRTLLLDGASGGTAGFIDTNGHTVVVAGSFGELASGLGLLKTGAGTLVLNGVQAYSGETIVDEGTLSGHGEVQRLLMQGAALAPGESAGLFSVREGLSFASGARLVMELGGLTRGSEYDALNVGGTLDLGDGTELMLSFIGGFTAQAGQEFRLLSAAGGLLGQFANVADGGRLLTTDGAGSFVVHYGSDGGLVLSDFSPTAVPEPGSWVLMLAGMGLVAWRRRRTG